ncbi:MAG: type II toxin-antitoxin system RelE/ParE family toxin [Casimicrobiaceae bacterium]
MAYQLIWSAEAETDFKNIILYLKTSWSLQSAEKFILQTYKKLERLVAMPSIGRSTSHELIYMIKPDRKNALFFSLDENFLILLGIYPYKKDITKSKYY